ncbi:hypothetical protein JAAARDRAFT_40076 [Jaapia argillacea MUCL 33604]|uniref:TPR-like protein n=1 Tax=Jaapia argillacea MUCL 33604 TaxID=933084 RepID=A0A067PC60_9AGAM|nr:hypothetical protein JAAARDRAFT_40076 [Jaapia argillacea MUCL 33604]
MAHAKDQHYWAQLRAALSAGDWASSSAGKAPNGAPLSWSELLRKFNKHCKGFKDFSEIASQTQYLGLLLGGKLKTRDLDGYETPYGYLGLGAEGLLPEERFEDGTEGYEALKRVETPNLDSLHMALAYFSYALGRPEECIGHLSLVQNVSDFKDRVTPTSSIRSDTISSLQVPGTGSNTPASTLSGSFVSSDFLAMYADVRDGRAWAMTESIRSVCLKGMSFEQLSADDIQKALDSYLAALPLLTTIENDIPRPSAPSSTPIPGYGAGKLEFSSFVQYRELWRWTERLLWRAILLAARVCTITSETEGTLWSLFRHYHNCSAHWPPNFRTEHRSTITVLYFRALVLQARGSIDTSSKPSMSPDSVKPPPWLGAARSVAQEHRAVLNASTKFPRAGERNVKVEEFVDLCVAAWEAAGAVGEYAGWVIEILWWATRLTFNSHRVYRHMTRLLFASGDTDLAKRTLRLYVQVVSKARETGASESEESRESSGGGKGIAVDADTDLHWVETLVHGARMLCRLASAKEGRDGLDEVREAGSLIEKARSRLDKDDKVLVASVDLAEGIWHSMIAVKEQDPLTRSSRFDNSLAALQRSVDHSPISSAHYHLALALSRPGPSRNLDQALANARLAVESDPDDIRYWHFLGLLLIATGDWKSARSILEFGAALGEEDGEVDGAHESQDGVAERRDTPTPTGARPRDYVNGRTDAAARLHPDSNGFQNGHSSPTTETAIPDGDGISVSSGANPVFVLEKDATRIPYPETLLQSLPDHPVPTRNEIFEQSLQLRMTQAALTEMVEGPEGAENKWVDVFRWCNPEKRGMASDQDSTRSSFEGSRMSTADLEHLSDIGIPQQPQSTISAAEARQSVGSDGFPAEGQSMPVPITLVISPATPTIHTPIEGLPISSDPSPLPTRSNSYEKKSNSFDRKSGSAAKRSNSFEKEKDKDKEKDSSAGKKMQQMLKNRVHKGQARISTISKKIGHGVARGSVGQLRRTNSAPNFHSLLNRSPYQASSIHRASRKYLVSPAARSQQSLMPPEEAPPPPSVPPPQPVVKWNKRIAREKRLLSDLWLMSAATFRRLGKIEQAKGAIQEAEVRDPRNPAVWVQLGLYYSALNNHRRAREAFQKALFMAPHDVSAIIHLCRLYLSLPGALLSGSSTSKMNPDPDNVDLAAGMLTDLTRGAGWDVPEAWYFLAKTYHLQGRKESERECLSFALGLSEGRSVRDTGLALGWCV